jgi:hypothetical protein
MATTTQKERTGFNDPSQTVAETAKSGASAVGEAARGAASAVAEKAEDAAKYLGRQAEDATMAVGTGMKNLAGTIRDKGPHEGMLGSAGGAVADTLESSGQYLEKHGLSGIGEDMTALIRRNPIPAVLIGIAVGYLISRATRT